MESGIYIIKNNLNGKVYVGSAKKFSRRKTIHFSNLRKNKHCNIKLQRAFNKHGEAAFNFEIVEFAEYNRSILLLEDLWIEKFNSKKCGYNIANASYGDTLSSHPNKEEIKIRISDGLRKTFGKMSESERKRKFSKPGSRNPMYGIAQTQKVKDALAKHQKQFMLTNGHGYSKGIPKTKEHRAKMSANAKTRIGKLNPFYGKTHSAETKKAFSEKRIGRKCSTLRPIILNDIRYERLKDAHAATGTKISTLHYRAKSENFKNIWFEDSPKKP